ncbi:MAG: class I SAM-dependent methyltransferase [Bifidobacteriaceae bacterium]|nr:class I SAM-dependent methyltransferase [Bifidobacteriaceae bacterium]
MDLADVALLTSATGRHLLEQLSARVDTYTGELALKLADGLRRRGADPKLVAAALTQLRLRTRARAKFGDFAADMLFTDHGLAQATRIEVAARHAERYRAAGFTHVADLTGGIGGDALAFAALGIRVRVFESDPVTAAVAAANLAAFPEAQVVAADSLSQDLTGCDALWADPSRRAADGRRVFDPAAYSPPLDAILQLAERSPLGVKVSPGLPHGIVPGEAESQWVSVDGAVVEATWWFGPLRAASGARRSALVLRGGRAHHLMDDAVPPLPAGPLGACVYEPDGAVIRAHLLEQAARELDDARLAHPAIAYITSDRANGASPFLTGWRVLDAFPFNLRRLRAYLRERGVGQLVVKKRGTAVEPAELRKRLQLRGDAAATVILTRLGARQSVLVVEPLETR